MGLKYLMNMMRRRECVAFALVLYCRCITRYLGPEANFLYVEGNLANT